MTAQRWWVRLAARWLARVDGVSGQLRLAMLALTGVSTATLSLQSYGYGHLAVPLIVGLSATGLVYTYLYTEGGVWNQMGRDRTDMSTNYSGPNMRMEAEIYAAAIVAGMKGRELDDSELQAISETADEPFLKYRDGIPEDKLQ